MSGFLGELVDELVDGLSVGDVAGTGQGAAPVGLDGLHRFGESLGISSDTGHLSAVGPDRLGHRLAQSARSPGDDGHLTGQVDRQSVIRSVHSWRFVTLPVARRPAALVVRTQLTLSQLTVRSIRRSRPRRTRPGPIS